MEKNEIPYDIGNYRRFNQKDQSEQELEELDPELQLELEELELQSEEELEEEEHSLLHSTLTLWGLMWYR